MIFDQKITFLLDIFQDKNLEIFEKNNIFCEKTICIFKNIMYIEIS